MHVAQKACDLSLRLIAPFDLELVDEFSSKNLLSLVELANDLQRRTKLAARQSTIAAISLEPFSVWMILGYCGQVDLQGIRVLNVPAILSGSARSAMIGVPTFT